ncbi:MAG: hypothetical protein ACI4MQ_07840 [Candidatus Coproplasma sp.]
MASNKKKDKAIGAFSVISIILCLCALCLGFLKSQSEDLFFNLEYPQKVGISNFQELTALGETVYNNEIVLTDDIHINEKDFRIGTTQRPFAGTFDGKGHTIYIDYTSVDQSTSIFGCISALGLVKNTNFVFGNITVDDNTYGGIAKINYGTVQDCTVECSDMKIKNGKGIYSPCVTINNGTISNVIVYCTLTSQNFNADESAILFGGVCTFNYGTVKNCISISAYNRISCTQEFNILTGQTTNVGVGSVYAVNTSGATITNSVTVLQDGVYTSDKSSGIKVVGSISEIANPNTFFFELDFSNTVWIIQSGKLMLIEG